MRIPGIFEQFWGSSFVYLITPKASPVLKPWSFIISRCVFSGNVLEGWVGPRKAPESTLRETPGSQGTVEAKSRVYRRATGISVLRPWTLGLGDVA